MALNIKAIVDIEQIKTNGQLGANIGLALAASLETALAPAEKRLNNIFNTINSLKDSGRNIKYLDIAFNDLAKSVENVGGNIAKSFDFQRGLSRYRGAIQEVAQGFNTKKFNTNQAEQQITKLAQHFSTEFGSSLQATKAIFQQTFQDLAANSAITQAAKKFEEIARPKRGINQKPNFYKEEELAQARSIEIARKYNQERLAEEAETTARIQDLRDKQKKFLEDQQKEQKTLSSIPQNIRDDKEGRTGSVRAVQAAEIQARQEQIEADKRFYAEKAQQAKELADLGTFAANQSRKQAQASARDALDAARQEKINVIAEEKAKQEEKLAVGDSFRKRIQARLDSFKADDIQVSNNEKLEDQYAKVESLNRQKRIQEHLLRFKADDVAADKLANQTKKEQAALVRELTQLYDRLNAEIKSTEVNLRASGQRSSDTLKALVAARDKVGAALGGGRIGGPPGGPPGPPSPPGGPPPDPNTVRRLLETAAAQRTLRAETQRASSAFYQFGQQAALAFRRYSAFLVGTRLSFAIGGAIREAQQEFLRFEEQLTKLEQISDASRSEINALGNDFLSLSQKTSISATEIAKATQTLAQAGFSKAGDLPKLKQFAEQIAKVPLAATFGTIDETTDGLIAIFGQFNKELEDTGYILNLVNEYANDFAIEAGDIFEIVKRGGSVFSTAGGSLEEIIELGSLVRSSTRLSAETIGTFFKTGFSQLLSSRAQAQMKLMGVTATNVTDQIKQLAEKYKELDLNSQIREANELLGSRQVGPFLGLIRELNKTDVTAVLADARQGIDGSLDRSVAKRLDDVGVSLTRIRKNIEAFYITLVNNDGIKKFIKDIADLTTNLKGLISTLAPLLPLLATVLGIGAIKGAANFARGFATTLGFGGQISNVGSSLTNTFENSKNIRILGSVIPAAGFVGPPNAQISQAIGERGQLLRENRRALLTGGLNAGTFAAGLIAQSIGNDLANSPNVNEARRGRRVSTVAGFATSGAVIGSFLPGLGTLAGGVIGAAIGSLKAFTDATKEAQESLRDLDIRKAGTNPDKLFGTLGTSRADQLRTKKAIEKEIATQQSITGNKLGLSAIGNIVGKARLEDSLNTQERFAEAFENLGTDDKNAKILEEAIKQSFAQTQKDIAEEIRVSPEKRNTLIASAEDRASAEAARRAVESTGGDVVFEDIFVKIIEAIQNKLISGINTSSLSQEGTPLQVFQDKINAFLDGLDFTQEAEKINRAFRNVATGLLDINQTISRDSDRINSVIFDTQAINRPTSPSDRRDQISFFGLDPIANIDNQNRQTANELEKFFSKVDNISILETFIDNVKQSGQESKNTSKDSQNKLLEDFFNTSKAPELGDFLKTVEQLAAESGRTPIQITEDLLQNQKTPFLQQIEGIRGTGSLSEALDAAARDFENFNRQQDAIAQLNDTIRTLGSTATGVKFEVDSLSDALEDRIAEQADFLRNDTNGIRSNQELADRRQLSVSRLNLADPNSIIASVLAARQRLNTAAGNLNKGSNSDQLEANRVASDAARKDFLDASQAFEDELRKYDVAVSAASQATDALRAAFKEFDGQIQAAGAAVSQLTVSDLRDGLNAFKQFQKGGLESLSDADFGQLEKILGAVGDFKLPGLQSGNDFLRDIREQLALPFLAGFSREQNGLSIQENERLIREIFEKQRQEAEAAAVAEKDLREKQLKLINSQVSTIELERQFYQSQADALKPTGKAPIEDIRNLLTTVFGGGKSIPVTLNQSLPQNGNPNFVPTVPNTVNQPVNFEQINTSLVSIGSSFDRISESVRGYTEVIERLITQGRNGETAKAIAATLEIAPIQVNVALTAPDILKLAGTQIYKAVLAKIQPALSQAFGVISPEARNSFDSNIPRE